MSDIKEENIIVRLAEKEDAKEILDIYAPYVTDTAITFEYQVPKIEEFTERMEKILQKYPYLVAEGDGQLLGYAYASSFKERAAYEWSAETSIYVRKDCCKRGIGHLLYRKLEAVLKAQNILNMNACIAYPNPESIRFHEKMGYTLIAHFTKCGYKLGKWYDMVWMEKMLGEHTINPQKVVCCNALDVEDIISNNTHRIKDTV